LISVIDDEPDAVELPIDGILDLHTFDPSEVRQLVPDYIKACLEKGIFQIRIIHGKGKGVLRRITHSILDKHPAVLSYRLDPDPSGSWGATLVELKNHPDSA
jgi:DNA-nicking Smr family endonuclease